MLVSNALIGLREGLEAALVVVILAGLPRQDGPPLGAPLRLARRRRRRRALGACSAPSLTYGTQQLSFEAQELIGGLASIIAVGFVTGMVFWMRSAVAHHLGRAQGQARPGPRRRPAAPSPSSRFLGVGREGLETAIFFYATAQAAGAGQQPAAASAGSSASAARCSSGSLIYRGALKINLGAVLQLHRHPARSSSPPASSPTASTTCRRPAFLPGLNNLAFDVSATVDPTVLVRAPCSRASSTSPRRPPCSRPSPGCSTSASS